MLPTGLTQVLHKSEQQGRPNLI